MDTNEYNRISIELQELSKTMPLNWGKIQNNKTDANINMFSFNTKDQLEQAILDLDEDTKNYFRRRWFLWQCSRVDEYLFYRENSVVQNPNSKDQDWDIEFNHNSKLRFDVKGTIVPKELREGFKVSQEEKIIDFYYKNQSKGVRYNIQNRLFIVHHSYRNSERSMYLRCHWKLKELAYKYFTQNISKDTNFISYKTTISKCIFIMESDSNEYGFQIN